MGKLCAFGGRSSLVRQEGSGVERYRDRITIPSGFEVILDGKPNLPHNSGGIGIRTGAAGRVGGKIRTGLHVDGAGSPASRVGLTVQQAMGVPVDAWGEGGLHAKKPIAEIMT